MSTALVLRTGPAINVPDLLDVVNQLIIDINAQLLAFVVGNGQSITIAGGATGGTIATDGTNYTGARSYQPVGPDLNLAATAGRDVADGSSFLAAVMGNALGDSLTKTATIIGGVIGAFSITGTKLSTFQHAAVLGIVMDLAKPDAAFMAVIEGDSGLLLPGAAYAIGSNNSTPGSGFQYGLDLYRAAHDGYLQPSITKALIRSPNQVVFMEGAGAPVDGTTGDNFAGTGSVYIDYTNANMYFQTSAITTPVWKLVTRAA